MSTSTCLHLHSAVFLAEGHSQRLLAKTRAPDPRGHLFCLEQHRSSPAISHLTNIRKIKEKSFCNLTLLNARRTMFNRAVPYFYLQSVAVVRSGDNDLLVVEQNI